MNDLYDTDILAWSDQQATLLRQYSTSRPHVDHIAPNEIGPDWLNIIEEIESVGKSELHAVESLLFQAFVHGLKAKAWPLSLSVPGWQGEARGFMLQARRRFAASMRDKIDVPGLYADALRTLPGTMDGQPPLPVPPTCTATVDDLLIDSDWLGCAAVA